jgi:predicted transcriptional regulator
MPTKLKTPAEKYKRTKKLDELDNIMLYLIAYGGDSLAYLSTVLDQPKTTLSDRVKQLESLGLVESVETKTQHNYRKYVMTEMGLRFVNAMNILSNLLLLESVKLPNSK